MGNVTRRLDGATGRDEGFIYDGLNRLTVHSVAGGATVTETYDALGNITNKLDVGAYVYGGTRPHAVTSAPGYSCSYDEDGNMLTDGTRTYTWTSFNQVKKITQGGINTQFSFGAGHKRVVPQHSNGTKTIYIGSLYEKVTSPGGVAEEKHFIYTPLGRTAVRSVRSDGTVETRYFHQDGLGSIYAVTDELGRVEKRFTFDAWGKWVKTADTHTASGGTVTRGYTDHEQLDDFGLIHMNGRIYDPTLGRFLSADPFVEEAKDSQAFNRYSYVSNNPLNATDPSGYTSLKEVLPAVIGVVIAIVVTVYCGPQGGAAAFKTWSAFWAGFQAGAASGAAIAGGAAGGFGSSFSGSLLNGGSVGDAFKAGVVGAAVGAATAWASQGIGNYFGPNDSTFETWAGRTLAHACVGGLASEAQGGEFRHGFYSSAASAGIMHMPGVNTLMGGNQGGWWIAARTATAATIGGTASVVGGGKFANAAVTSAFQQLFNQEASKAANRELEMRVEAEMLKNLLDKQKAGIIRLPNAAEQKVIDSVITGLQTFQDGALQSVGRMLARRTILVDESMISDPDLLGETTPILAGFSNVIRINPLRLQDPGFYYSDGNGNKTLPYAAFETLSHENLHLIFFEMGFMDPGGKIAHGLMDQYQRPLMRTIVREGTHAEVFGK